MSDLPVDELVPGAAGHIVHSKALNAAYNATRSQRQFLEGLDYLSTHYATAGDAESIRDAIAEAEALGATKDARRLVILPAGTYDVSVSSLTSAEGVDVAGETEDPDDVIITSDESFYTYEASARNTMLAYITIKHTGDQVEYALHSDTLATVILPQFVAFQCKFITERKSSVGIGTRDGQRLWFIDCLFHILDTYGDVTNGAFFEHNNYAAAMSSQIVCVSCTAINESDGPGVYLNEFQSTKLDTVYWFGGSIEGAPGNPDIYVSQDALATSTYYMDPDAYEDVEGSIDGSTVPDIVTTEGVSIPMPDRLPTAALPLLGIDAVYANNPAITSPETAQKYRAARPTSIFPTAATPQSIASGNRAVAADDLYVQPIFVPIARHVDAIQMIVATAGAGLARLMIFDDDGTTYPGALELDAGEIDVSGVGYQLQTFDPHLLTAGLKWVGFNSNVAWNPWLISNGSGEFLGVEQATATRYRWGFRKSSVSYAGGAPAAFDSSATFLNSATHGLPFLLALRFVNV